MRKKNRLSSRLRSVLPKKKGERRRAEFLAASAVSVLIVLVFLVSLAGKYFLAPNQYAAVISAVLVDLANGDRTAQNLGTLTVNPVLVAAAQAKADDMARYSYFAHVSPQGVDPWHWFQQAGYKFDYAGENLAVDFSDSGDVNSAWMNSPTHRENILGAHYTEIGIAISQGTFQGHPTTFVVQEFGKPSSSGVQRAVSTASIPKSPTQPALASATPSAVLGEAAKQPVTPPKSKAPVAQAPAPKQNEVLGSSVSPGYASPWQYIIASPRGMLRDTYYALALLVLLGLAFTTGFELHRRHSKKAAAAGIVLALMLGLFLIGESTVFTTPVVPQQATQTAAAGLAF